MSLDRSEAPAFQSLKSIDFFQPEKFSLSNSIPVNSINSGEQPVIRIDWISTSGKWQEPNPGISYFTLKMLGEGAGKFNSEELSEAFQQYGAFLELTNGFDYSTVSIYSLTKHLEPVIQLLRAMLTEPLFQDKELDNLKNIKIQEIRLNQEKNNIRASQLFRNAVFGNTHPYGKEPEEKEVAPIQSTDLKNYFRHQLLNQSQLIISGKIDEDHKKIIDQYLGTISTSQNEHSKSFNASPSGSNHVELGDSLQTSIRYGKHFLKMDHPDYVRMMVVNEILGGYFGSRLMKNIREDKGFTYGIYSSLIALKEAGYFVIGTDVKKENKAETVSEIKKEIDLLKTELVSLEELETVKNYMLGSLISSMDTAFDLADKFKTAHLKGLSMDYYDQLVQTIQTMDSLTIQRLASEYLDTDTFDLVTVG